MKKLALILVAISLHAVALARDPVLLRNDAWPPFIVPGKAEGTAEQLVCEALKRTGWVCSVEVEDWESVLNQVRIGAIDGVAAAWITPDRETFMLFSEPYLTNRIIPVVKKDHVTEIQSVADLAGLRVALVGDYAYGDEVEAARQTFNTVSVKNSNRGIKAVVNGEADVALVDELVARTELYKSENRDLVAQDSVLAYRSLHLAISKKNPLAAAIIDDFHKGYKMMLADGTVNQILNVDWLATDFGQAGNLNVVLRPGISLDDLSKPNEGSVYALEDSEYQMMRNTSLDNSRVNYQVEGKSYSSLQSALDTVFGKDTVVCKHKNYTSQFDCSDLFKKR